MYDSAYLRRSVRRGRERGCWVYVPAEELAKTRVGADGAPPRYRTTGRENGSTVVVTFYRDKVAAT